jgi:hypothetical protein
MVRVLAAVAMIAIGCAPTMSDAAWVWCQEHVDAVLTAAANLGMDYAWPWEEKEDAAGVEHAPDVLASDADFARACRQALADEKPSPFLSISTGGNLAIGEASQCLAGVPDGALDTAASEVGIQRVRSRAPTAYPMWGWRNLSGPDLRADGDYAKACMAAFGGR